MPPEMWDVWERARHGEEKGKYEGEKVDVWCLGVILYELVCGVTPWVAANRAELVRDLKEKEPVMPKHLSLPLKELLIKMLVKKAERRIPWKEILCHDWVQVGFLQKQNACLEARISELEATKQAQGQNLLHMNETIKALMKKLGGGGGESSPTPQHNLSHQCDLLRVELCKAQEQLKEFQLQRQQEQELAAVTLAQLREENAEKDRLIQDLEKGKEEFQRLLDEVLGGQTEQTPGHPLPPPPKK